MKKFLIKIIYKIILSIFILCISYSSYSKNNDIKQEVISNIANIYNKYPLVKSKFLQVDSLGKESVGWFIFDKNNAKARIEYTDIPLRIIINNNSIMIEQIDLKEKTFSPLLSSPFKFIINKNVNLNNPEINITNFYNNSNYYYITIAAKQNSFKGFITLCFNSKYHLSGWELEDELGNTTKFTLLNPEYLHNKIPSTVFNTHRVTKINYNDFK